MEPICSPLLLSVSASELLFEEAAVSETDESLDSSSSSDGSPSSRLMLSDAQSSENADWVNS